MKKQYINPDIEEVLLDTESLLNVVSGGVWEEGVGDGQVGDETPDLSKSHNSAWDEWE